MEGENLDPQSELWEPTFSQELQGVEDSRAQAMIPEPATEASKSLLWGVYADELGLHFGHLGAMHLQELCFSARVTRRWSPSGPCPQHESNCMSPYDANPLIGTLGSSWEKQVALHLGCCLTHGPLTPFTELRGDFVTSLFFQNKMSMQPTSRRPMKSGFCGRQQFLQISPSASPLAIIVSKIANVYEGQSTCQAYC